MPIFPNTGFSTYATILLSGTPLADIIRNHSGSQSDTTPKDFAGLPKILTAGQIKASLQNPQSAIKPAMATYAKEIAIRRDISQTDEEFTGYRKWLRAAIKELKDRTPNTINPVQLAELQSAIHELETTYKKTVDKHKELPDLKTRLATFDNRIEKNAIEQEKLWDVFKKTYAEKMRTEFEQAGLNLNEEEVADLLNTNQSLEDLESRFKASNLALPAWAAEPDFTTLFKLKAMLVMNSYLERRKLPHSAKDITQVLKKSLKTDPQSEGIVLHDKNTAVFSRLRDDLETTIAMPLQTTVPALKATRDTLESVTDKYKVAPPEGALPGVEPEKPSAPGFR